MSKEESLEVIIRHYIRATTMTYSEVYSVFNVILNYLYDKEREQ